MKTIRYIPFLFLWLPLLLPAQDFVVPSLPTARLTDYSPLFHAVQANRFVAEIGSTQQYMAIKGHPQTYRLSLAGTPAPLYSNHSALTFHGDVYSSRSGFYYDIHTAFGTTASIRVHTHWKLYAGLNYDFGYRHYNFHDVITEHPDYNNIRYGRYFHSPSASLGFVHHHDDYRLGFTAAGAVSLPNNDFSVSGTFFFERSLGLYANTQHRANILPYVNYTYYSYGNTGHTVTAGFNARYGIFYASILYRATKDVQTAGLGMGFDLGKYCHLGYNLLLPFRFSGIMAGVAAHNLSFKVSLAQRNQRWLPGKEAIRKLRR